MIDKGEETCSLDVAPLALWDPNRGLYFGTKVSVIDGFSSKDELEPSLVHFVGLMINSSTLWTIIFYPPGMRLSTLWT